MRRRGAILDPTNVQDRAAEYSSRGTKRSRSRRRPGQRRRLRGPSPARLGPVEPAATPGSEPS
jgi:hypothetical protein